MEIRSVGLGVKHEIDGLPRTPHYVLNLCTVFKERVKDLVTSSEPRMSTMSVSCLKDNTVSMLLGTSAYYGHTLRNSAHLQSVFSVTSVSAAIAALPLCRE
jgi:hypothetical protein